MLSQQIIISIKVQFFLSSYFNIPPFKFVLSRQKILILSAFVNIIFLILDMIDKVLGFEPAPRRRRQDNQSQTSSIKEPSVKEFSEPVRQTPSKTFIKRQPSEDPQLQEPKVEKSIVSQISSPVKQKKVAKSAEKKVSSDEQIASPAVKNLKFAKVARTQQELKGSIKLNLRESVKKIEAPKDDETMYKLKIILFLIIGILGTVFAMTPSRKAPKRRN